MNKRNYLKIIFLVLISVLILIMLWMVSIGISDEIRPLSTSDIYQSIKATFTPDIAPNQSLNPISAPISIEYAVPVCADTETILSFPDDLELPGTIVYQKSHYQGLYTLGGVPLNQSSLTANEYQHFIVYGFSPNGEWLAYSQQIEFKQSDFGFETPTMTLLSYTGERIEFYIDISQFEGESGDDRYFIALSNHSYWINDKLIYTDLLSNPVPSVGGSLGMITPKLLDPFTQKWQIDLINDLPDKYEIVPTRFKNPEIGISPDLTRVLYPTNNGKIVLYNPLVKTVIWENEINNDSLFIRWSPNNEMVSVGTIGVPPEERQLWILSNDGSLQQEIIGSIYPSSEYGQILYLAWSPNSRYLAIIYDETFKYVYIYDTLTDKYLYHCQIEQITDYFPHLIWSPNSEWVLLTALDSPLQVLNIETGNIFTLLDEGIAFGWSDKFPAPFP